MYKHTLYENEHTTSTVCGSELPYVMLHDKTHKHTHTYLGKVHLSYREGRCGGEGGSKYGKLHVRWCIRYIYMCVTKGVQGIGFRLKGCCQTQKKDLGNARQRRFPCGKLQLDKSARNFYYPLSGIRWSSFTPG